MGDNKKYKLAGTWLFLDEGIPETSWPVFKGEDGKLYFANVEEDPLNLTMGTQILSFEEIGEKGLQHVHLFSDQHVINETDQEEYGIGDEGVLAFNFNAESSYVGTYEKYLTFITSYRESIKDSRDEHFLKALDDDIEDITERLKRKNEARSVEPTP